MKIDSSTRQAVIEAFSVWIGSAGVMALLALMVWGFVVPR